MCCVSPRWSGLHVVIFSMMAAFTACTTGCRSKDVLLLSPSCINSLLKAIVLITEVTLKLIHSSHVTNVSGSEPTLCWSASFVPVMHYSLYQQINTNYCVSLSWPILSILWLFHSLTACWEIFTLNSQWKQRMPLCYPLKNILTSCDSIFPNFTLDISSFIVCAFLVTAYPHGHMVCVPIAHTITCTLVTANSACDCQVN